MKLSKRVLEIVEERQRGAELHAKIAARMSWDDPTLPNCWTRTEEYYHGLRDAAYGTIESLLMAHNCYDGFYHWHDDETDAHWRVYSLRKAR